jgi:hypothetical protein
VRGKKMETMTKNSICCGSGEHPHLLLSLLVVANALAGNPNPNPNGIYVAVGSILRLLALLVFSSN